MKADELKQGQELPTRTFGPITRTDIVRYQGASGDFNPIHHDEPFAREAGFATVISVGMLQAGYVGTYCVDLFGPDTIREFRVRFRNTVRTGDVASCKGTVTAVEALDGGGRQCTLEILMTRAQGEVVLDGAVVIAEP